MLDTFFAITVSVFTDLIWSFNITANGYQVRSLAACFIGTVGCLLVSAFGQFSSIERCFVKKLIHNIVLSVNQPSTIITL